MVFSPFSKYPITDASLVVLMDLGFVTHAVHANSRMMYLHVVVTTAAKGSVLTVQGPPNVSIYPPGPGWIYVVANGVPSKGIKVMVGSGDGPAVDEEAIRKSVLLFCHLVLLN